jgi:hypothetical protein
LLGLEQVPWNDRFKEMRKRMEAARAGRK